MDRALGTGPVLRPRLASRFEPGTIDAPLAAAPDAAPAYGFARVRRSTRTVDGGPHPAAAIPPPLTTILREPGGEPRTEAPAPSRTVPALSRGGRPALIDATGEPRPDDRPIASPSRVSAQPARPGPTSEPTAAAMLPLDAVARGQVPAPRPSRDANRDPRTGPVVVDSVREPPIPPAGRRRAASALAPPPAPIRPASAPEPPLGHPAARASMDPRESAVDRRPGWPVVAAPRSVGPASPSPAIEAMPSERNTRVEASRPIVRVSIGRIEVRAVAPPTPPRRGSALGKDPTHGQVPSLEEYLLTRNGRSR